MTLKEIRDHLAAALETARTGGEAVNEEARSFNLGYASGLQEALKLIDRTLDAERATRIKDAMQGRDPGK